MGGIDHQKANVPVSDAVDRSDHSAVRIAEHRGGLVRGEQGAGQLIGRRGITERARAERGDGGEGVVSERSNREPHWPDATEVKTFGPPADTPRWLGLSPTEFAMSTIESLRDQITHEEQVANLRPDGTVSESEIHRRRLQIFFVALVVLVGLLITTAANDLWSEMRDRSWLDPQVTRIALIVFASWFAVYVFDKEQHLKRLSRLGHDVDLLDRELAAGLLHSALVADAIELVHEDLDLDLVVARVLEQTCALTGADDAAVFLVDDEDALHPVGTQGTPRVGDVEALRALVIEEHGVVELSTEHGSRLCAPLVHRGELFGVLLAEPLHATQRELRALLARFAPAAATAIANGRRYEASVFLLDVA